MPFVEDSSQLGSPPKEPHLAIETDTGLFTAIPPGGHIALVEDPNRYDGIFKLILLSVHHNKLVFRCGCGQAECSRVVTFKGTWKGRHVYQDREQR